MTWVQVPGTHANPDSAGRGRGSRGSSGSSGVFDSDHDVCNSNKSTEIKKIISCSTVQYLQYISIPVADHLQGSAINITNHINRYTDQNHMITKCRKCLWQEFNMSHDNSLHKNRAGGNMAQHNQDYI